MRSTLLLALFLVGCGSADPEDGAAGTAPDVAPARAEASAEDEELVRSGDPGAPAPAPSVGAGAAPGRASPASKSARRAPSRSKKRAVVEADPAPDPVEAWYEALPESAIVYNRPETVPFGQTFDVELFIDITGDAVATVEALDDRRDANPNLVGDTRSAPARTGDEVEVQLLGSNAIIDTLEPTSQLLTSRRPGHWHWRIRPAEPDDIVLTLHVMAIQPGRATGLKVKSYEDTIVVRVTTVQRARIWVADNWEWAWTFIVAPIGGWIFARMRRRRRGGAETGEE